MTEPIEQLVVRLAGEHLRYQVEGPEVSGVIAFAKACMAEQANADERLCDAISAAHWAAYKRGAGPERANPYYDGKSDGASECSAAIFKAAEGLK